MTEHTGLPVKGYTPQSTKAVDLVNENKVIEERLLRHCERINKRDEIDGRWIAIAKTHFQEGFMALNRAIFKPARVNLPEDPTETST